ncbi:MAG: KEOPS complex subunit Pcc1 [Candidatus Thermoplasmatota archaeon]
MFIAKIKLEYDNKDIAKTIYYALKPDNEKFVHSELSGNKIFSRIAGKSITKLNHTVDDYLACLAVAEEVALCMRKDGKK